MTMKLNRAAYEKMIQEDLEWLEKQPRTLERDHIMAIVKVSPKHEYEPLHNSHDVARLCEAISLLRDGDDFKKIIHDINCYGSDDAKDAVNRLFASFNQLSGR